jgi:hypothetical protein
MFCVKRTEKYQKLSEISSTNARDALRRVEWGPTVMVPDVGLEKGQIKPQTLQWLEREGLVICTVNRKKKTVWRTTELGRRLVRQHVPKFCSRSSVPAYTTSPSMALKDAGEVMDFPQAA